MRSLYAHIFTALAEGETQFEFWDKTGKWCPINMSEALAHVVQQTDHSRLRVRQATMTINGHVVLVPLKRIPEEGTRVYVPLWGSTLGLTSSTTVGSGPTFHKLLNYGLLHLTEEAADAHARALVSFTEIK